MNEFVNDLFASFQNISNRYYFTEVFRNIENYHQDQEAIIQSTENSFSAELFRFMRNRMELQENVERYNELALDFDVRKDYINPTIINRRLTSYRPDLVLHLSQLDWDPPYQKLYVEVKTKEDPYVKDDLQKLANAIYCLQFQNGVFISVNSNYELLISRIKRIIISENRRLLAVNIRIEWNRIYLFHSIIIDGVRHFSHPITFQNILAL